MSVKELIFNNSKWFNKQDYLIVPKTITIKKGATVVSWAKELNNDIHTEIVSKEITCDCVGVYAPSADYVGYAFDDNRLTTYDNPHGGSLCFWVKADKNVIPNWGGKTLLSHLWQALRAFAARKAVNA